MSNAQHHFPKRGAFATLLLTAFSTTMLHTEVSASLGGLN
eukprot:CAMPEP_0196584446 /NCGR_PEP_ID=MMETSP1081-20130531/47096_1 /TAXON_ID=36882 /ORGANISM="Pyramimonas amylifera, Strain CCMP720" /LENGTH=39 /DNA_ID= /DNA_START= /DNA_END= /DNA_ORIENTATION=